MFTIKFTKETQTQTDTYTRDTIKEAQSYARQWMNLYNSTEVFLTECFFSRSAPN
jgi:hypothetical protein